MMSGMIEAGEAAGLELAVQYASDAEGLPSEAELVRWVQAGLQAERDTVELTIRIVDEPESQRLNRDYRQRNQPTNVLSFPFEAPPGAVSELLGDLVICAPVVEREAVEQGKTLTAHWAHMVVHGVMHLLGYDHERDDEAERMEALEIERLASVGIESPYDD